MLRNASVGSFGMILALLMVKQTFFGFPAVEPSHAWGRDVSMPNAIPPETGSLAVLIVDDEPNILDLLRDILEGEGYTVVTASNGAAALYHIQRSPVALVLTDFMMPFVSGIDLARQVHSNPQTASIPLVLMSAVLPDQGSDMFATVIRKPFSLDTIVRMVHQLLPL